MGGFQVLEDIKLWSHDGRDWVPLADSEPDAVDWARGVRVSRLPLAPVESAREAWPFQPLLSPDATQVIVYWSRGMASDDWWLIDVEDSTVTFVPTNGQPLGWTDDGGGLYWKTSSGFSVQPIDGGALVEVLSVPEDPEFESLERCRPRRGVAAPEFLCIRTETEAFPTLREDFDPYVSGTGEGGSE